MRVINELPGKSSTAEMVQDELIVPRVGRLIEGSNDQVRFFAGVGGFPQVAIIPGRHHIVSVLQEEVGRFA